MNSRHFITEEKKGTLSVAASMFIFGTIGFFVKESGQTAVNVVFFRCLFAAFGLGIYAAVTSRIRREYFRMKVLLPLTASGAVLVANWAFLFKAFNVTSITMAVIFYYTEPFILILLGCLFLKDTLKPYHLFWTLTAFAGLITTTGLVRQGTVAPNIVQGAVFGVPAAVFYAAAVIIAKYHRDIPPIFIALMQTAIGSVLLLPFTSLSQVPSAGSHWAYLAALGIVHTALAYVLFYRGVHVLRTALVAVLGFFDPVVAIFSDVLIYHRQITGLQCLGIAMILLSGMAVELRLDAAFFKRLFRRRRSVRNEEG